MNSKLMNFLAGALLVAALPLSAHHSFSAEFDSDKPVKLEGTVVQNGMDESAYLAVYRRSEGRSNGALDGRRRGAGRSAEERLDQEYASGRNQGRRSGTSGEGRRVPGELQQCPVPRWPQARDW